MTPRVLLATPYYAGVSMGWHNTVNRASRDRSLLTVVKEAQASTSILPHTFNVLLAAALDLRDAGEVTHLAMAHSDICAEPGWLDTLYREAMTHRADLISAVVPIKAEGDRTSTAVGDRNDPWSVNRFIKLSDRWTLPTTFSAQDCCGPDEVLLVNSGLMLADLRKPWWDDFAFEFKTRVIMTDRGRKAEARSEDWELSRHVEAHGGKVMATFAPRLTHEGGRHYPNYEAPRGNGS